MQKILSKACVLIRFEKSISFPSLSYGSKAGVSAGKQLYTLDVRNNTPQFFLVAEAGSIEFHPLRKLKVLLREFA